MSRFTQYIGLTGDAQVFAKEMKEERVILTTGMFGEDVWGGVWNGRYKEVVQCAPWSSGPMIFTVLQDTVTGEELYPWVYDFDLDGEFDQVSGTYHV